MFKKKNTTPDENVETTIGPGTEFKGNISSKGVVRVDGTIEGEINTGDNLIVGEQGKVYANVQSKNVSVAGEVHGNLECSENLEILGTGKLFGDVKVTNLFIDDGAIFDGNCEMKKQKEKSKEKQ